MLSIRNTAQEALNRFDLHNGQFYGTYKYKNLQWELNGISIGFGDLTEDQILHIATCLEEGERFVGWNENHGGPWQQGDTPMIRISNENIQLRDEIYAQEGR